MFLPILYPNKETGEKQISDTERGKIQNIQNKKKDIIYIYKVKLAKM